MTKISEYTPLSGALSDSDLFDLSENTGIGSYDSRSLSYAQLKTNLTTDLPFSDTIYIADGSLTSNRSIDGTISNFNLTWENIGNFGVDVTSSFYINTDSVYVDASTGYVGIGTASPDTNLHVAGQVKITGGSPGADKVLTSDANGLATWETLTTFYTSDGTLSSARTVDMDSLSLGFTNASAGIAIGTATAHASAILDLTSTTEGFLPPRMTTAQVGAIAGPEAGLMVYDTDTNQWMGYNGTSWVILG